jgi:preprotein translocase subunit SecB
MTEKQPQAGADAGPQFGLVRIYLKDVSLETPNSPAIFLEEFRPDVNLQVNTAVKELDNSLYEVVLSITVTSTHNGQTAFLVEVQQAGIFEVRNFEEAHKGHMLGVFCPETLYPFAREAVAELVAKGGFPQLLLAPVNFEAAYAQKLSQEKQATSPAAPPNA